MRSETSSSNQTGGPNPWFSTALFRKNITRFWPVWALYGVIWFFMLAAPFLMNRVYGQSAENLTELSQNWVLQSITGGIVFAFGFGLLAAMSVFSYLHSHRSAGLMHALPIRREGLFLTNYLSGLTFLLGPHLIVFVLALAAEAAMGCLYFPALFTWLVVQSLMCLFFYSFAVFCAMFTGHLLALPVFYGVLNFLALGVTTLFDALMSAFLYGYASNDALNRTALWFTPVVKLFSEVWVESSPGATPAPSVLHGLLPVFVYGLAGLVLALLALLVYRRRQVESAGDVVSVGWMRPIFKYGVALCTSTALGTFLYAIFGMGYSSAWGLLPYLLICGAVGYFAAEMLLKKSFRVFKKSWPGFVALSAALVVLTCGLELDLFGFESRVPNPAAVSEVWVGGLRSAPYDEASGAGYIVTDPEEVARITALHAAIVAQKNTVLEENYWEGEQRILSDGGSATVQTEGYTSVLLTYTLTNGGQITRRYHSVPLRAAELSDPNSLTSMLYETVNDRARVEGMYFRHWNPQDRLVYVSLNTYSPGYPDNTVANTAYPNEDEAAWLVSAIRADIAAGRLGIRYLLDSEERMTNCSQTDLTLTFYTPDEPLVAPSTTTGEAAGRVYTQRADGAQQENTYTVTITPQFTATETLSALEDMGLLDDDSTLKAQSGIPVYVD